MNEPQNMVRAVFRSARLPDVSGPSGTLHIKLYYPAVYGDTPAERNTGEIPPDLLKAPFPIVIFAPGINLAPDSYAWMARGLAAKGYAVAVFHNIAEPMPGHISLGPALDMETLRADYTGGLPAGSAFAPILEMLERENASGFLRGALDMSSVHFGGHSAGGSTALLSANPAYFPALKSVFSYAAHTGMSTMMGYSQGAMKTIGDVPALIIGGTQDGCIANSAHRYGDPEGDTTGRVVKTFEGGVQREKGDTCLLILEGANHFTFGHPIDHTTGRSFIDMDETCDGDQARAFMLEAIHRFLQADIDGLQTIVDSPLVSETRLK